VEEAVIDRSGPRFPIADDHAIFAEAFVNPDLRGLVERLAECSERHFQ
jgi:hypothetical protein